MDKPEILVASQDDDEVFKWVSGGWYAASNGTRNTEEGKRLYSVANGCIAIAENVPDAIQKLENAGFRVVRMSKELIAIYKTLPLNVNNN